ncbi:Glutathione hydrolase proenzyme [Sodalis praecaptivus]
MPVFSQSLMEKRGDIGNVSMISPSFIDRSHYEVTSPPLVNVWIMALTLLVTAAPFVQAQTAAPLSYGVENDIFHPVTAPHGMVASVDKTATEVGVAILRQGGNAVDAAVAVGFALAVTHPQAGNLGGGGFMLLRTPAGQTVAIDFREMAPQGATRTMFIGVDGNADSRLSLTSPLASGTPGTVAGLTLALSRYGSMDLARVMQPAIRLAEQGFIVNQALAGDLAHYGRENLVHYANSRAVFLKRTGNPTPRGEAAAAAAGPQFNAYCPSGSAGVLSRGYRPPDCRGDAPARRPD